MNSLKANMNSWISEATLVAELEFYLFPHPVLTCAEVNPRWLITDRLPAGD